MRKRQTRHDTQKEKNQTYHEPKDRPYTSWNVFVWFDNMKHGSQGHGGTAGIMDFGRGIVFAGKFLVAVVMGHRHRWSHCCSGVIRRRRQFFRRITATVVDGFPQDASRVVVDMGMSFVWQRPRRRKASTKSKMLPLRLPENTAAEATGKS